MLAYELNHWTDGYAIILVNMMLDINLLGYRSTHSCELVTWRSHCFSRIWKLRFSSWVFVWKTELTCHIPTDQLWLIVSPNPSGKLGRQTQQLTSCGDHQWGSGTTSYGNLCKRRKPRGGPSGKSTCLFFNHRNRKMIRNWWFCMVFPQYYRYISWRITGTVQLHQLRQFAGLRWCRRMVCLAEQLGKVRCSNYQACVASLFSQKPKTLFRFLFGMRSEFWWIYDIYINLGKHG